MERTKIFTEEKEELIMQILKRGNDVEIKKVHGNLVIIEINRKMKSKSLL